MNKIPEKFKSAEEYIEVLEKALSKKSKLVWYLRKQVKEKENEVYKASKKAFGFPETSRVEDRLHLIKIVNGVIRAELKKDNFDVQRVTSQIVGEILNGTLSIKGCFKLQSQLDRVINSKTNDNI